MKAIKEHENGRNVNEPCRDLGVSTASFYKWRQRYGSLEVNELKRIKELIKIKISRILLENY